MKIVVTGAGGFVGSALCPALAKANHELLGREAIEGADAVVHLANVAHRAASVDEYRRVNVEGTRALARAAVRAGVKRFVYLSSIKVHGEAATTPVSESSPIAPADAYARSKVEAEGALRSEAGRSMSVLVLRPPLVYGPGVKANMRRLLNAIARGWPVPVAVPENRRSFLYVGNLVDAIERSLAHPQADGATFVLCDGESVSSAEFARAIGRALGRPARLWTLPRPLLDALAGLAGRRADVEKFAASLEVDDRLIRASLDWRPPHDLAAGLADMAAWFREAGR